MKTIKGFKAFNKGMKCRDFQYEEGKIYEEKSANICNRGFHFCENPLDVLNYYNLCDSEFAKVEGIGEFSKQKDGDTKISTTKIKIDVKINLADFIDSSVKFLIDLCNKKINKKDYTQQASSGYNTQQASSGYNTQQASSGYNTKQASSGYNTQQASSGDYTQQASSGYNTQQASSGDYTQQASSGDNTTCEINGEYSVSAAIGINSKIKGRKGNWITLAEWEYNSNKNKHIPICVKSIQIDGKKIKEDTYYQLKNKKFMECK